MQLAQRRPLEEAVYFGFALCSLYRIVPAAPGGLQQRDQRPSSSQKHIVADRPLTTVKHIESYLNNAKGNRGCAKAHFALKFVRDGSRSPMESALAITLGLPRIHGGFGLSVGQMNHAVRIFNGTDWAGERRYVTRYPDISIAHTDSSGRKNTVGHRLRWTRLPLNRFRPCARCSPEKRDCSDSRIYSPQHQRPGNHRLHRILQIC